MFNNSQGGISSGRADVCVSANRRGEGHNALSREPDGRTGNKRLFALPSRRLHITVIERVWVKEVSLGLFDDSKMVLRSK